VKPDVLDTNTSVYNMAVIATVAIHMVVMESYQHVDVRKNDVQARNLDGVEVVGQIWYIKLINHIPDKLIIKLILTSNILVVTEINAKEI
jgi:hypothetical protein